eukprot:Nk52_evm29s1569 gene=Nk52_evmTU29s1569
MAQATPEKEDASIGTSELTEESIANLSNSQASRSPKGKEAAKDPHVDDDVIDLTEMVNEAREYDWSTPESVKQLTQEGNNENQYEDPDIQYVDWGTPESVKLLTQESNPVSQDAFMSASNSQDAFLNPSNSQDAFLGAPREEDVIDLTADTEEENKENTPADVKFFASNSSSSSRKSSSVSTSSSSTGSSALSGTSGRRVKKKGFSCFTMDKSRWADARTTNLITNGWLDTGLTFDNFRESKLDDLAYFSVEVSKTENSTAWNSCNVGEWLEFKRDSSGLFGPTGVRLLNSKNEEVGFVNVKAAGFLSVLLDDKSCAKLDFEIEVPGTWSKAAQANSVQVTILGFPDSKEDLIKYLKQFRPNEGSFGGGIWQGNANESTQEFKKVKLDPIEQNRKRLEDVKKMKEAIMNDLKISGVGTSSGVVSDREGGILSSIGQKVAAKMSEMERSLAEAAMRRREIMEDSPQYSQHYIDFDSAERDQQLDMLFDEMESKNSELASVAPVFSHPKLKTKLMPHQNVGVYFMMNKELGLDTDNPFYVKQDGLYHNKVAHTTHATLPPPVKGGLLADDMGLGKSIQTIALIVARPKEAARFGGTLIVCPASVIDSWVEQINEHCVDGALKVHAHIGKNRIWDKEKLLKYDVVITSYDTLHREPEPFPEPPAQPCHDSLRAITWHRIVLDESHIIRNHLSKRTVTLLNMQGHNRWCLSGTPIVNEAKDIYSICAFLQFNPFNDLSVFNRAIKKPIKKNRESGVRCLRATVKTFSLRRDKSILAQSIPPKTIEVRSVWYPRNSVHKKVYDGLFGSFHGVLRRIATRHLLQNYSSVLELILRLRQTACSAALVPMERIQGAQDILEEFEGMYGKGTSKVNLSPEEAAKLLEALRRNVSVSQVQNEQDEAAGIGTGDGECCICLEQVTDVENARILRKCKHFYCADCIDGVLRTNPKCPQCRSPFNEKDILTPNDLEGRLKDDDDGNENVDENTDFAKDIRKEMAPKVKALIAALIALPIDEKALVFSNFRMYLHVIADELDKNAIKYVVIDGTVPLPQRKANVDAFRSDESIKVFLISMKAGGVGLNLTRANNVFIMDTWWNKAVENQAMDRVHRLGQTRECKIVKFITKNTIEEPIMELQELKDAIATATMKKNCPEEMQRIRRNQVINLLQLREPGPEDMEDAMEEHMAEA